MLELWIKTKETKEEGMFGRFATIEECFIRFQEHVTKMDIMQEKLGGKPYTFTAYIETEEGEVIISTRSFKAELKKAAKEGRLIKTEPLTTKDIEVQETVETAKELDVLPHKAVKHYEILFTHKERGEIFQEKNWITCPIHEPQLTEAHAIECLQEDNAYFVIEILSIQEIGD